MTRPRQRQNAVDLFFVDSLRLIVRSDDKLSLSSVQRENA